MNILKKTLVIALVAATGGSGTVCATDAVQAVIIWAREHAQPIDTTQPGHGLEDLQGLQFIVGDAQLVGIGESEHYIGEFFAMKHRIVEFLVKEMGFTAVALEAGFGDAKVLHDYVMGGPPVPGMWDTGLTAGHAVFQEIRDMVEWMRAYNAQVGKSRKVHLYGTEYLGFNGTWMPSLEPVIGYLLKVDPGFAEQMQQNLLPLVEKFEQRTDPRTDPYYHSGLNHVRHHEAYTNTLTDADKQALTAQIAILLYRMENFALLYREVSTPEEYDWAYQLAQTLRQADRYYRLRPHPIENWAKLSEFERRGAGNIRAVSVRENVSWMLGHGDKVILLVHNLHVSKSGDMGMALSDLLGDDYVTIGATYSTGTTIQEGLNRDFTPVQQGPSTYEGLDGLLAEVHLPIFLLDLGQVPDQGSVRDWLNQPRKTRAIGGYFGKGIALEDWNALYFIRDIKVGTVVKPAE